MHLIGLEITGGHREADVQALGGGISSDGGVLTLSKVSVRGNVAVTGGTTANGGVAQGGGIYFATGVLRVTDSKITDNWAISSSPHSVVALGGGIRTSGTLSVVRSSVSSNHVLGDSSDEEAEVAGGGIRQSDGPVSVSSSHIDGNRATSHGVGDGQTTGADGGGVAIDNGAALSITHSTVSGNRLTAVASGVDSSALGTGGAISAHVTRGVASDSAFLGNRVTGVSEEGPAAVLGGALDLSPSQSFSLTRTRIVGSVESADGGLDGNGYGGGISYGGDLSVSSSTVFSNTIRVHGGSDFGDGAGGGIFDGSGGGGSPALTVRKSTVDANRLLVSSDGADSTAAGGGISAGGALTMSRSTVSGNVASAGLDGRAGGLALSGSMTDSIVNSTIASNQAAGFHSNAGGIETDAQTLNVTDTTVARNSAGSGGGLVVTGGTTTLRATIVAKNTASHSPDCRGLISSAGHNLIGKTLGCAGFGATASDKKGVDAKLGLLAANGGPTRTLALLSGSPALNAIPPAQCAVAKDQRGVKRPQGTRCDIGSFERAT